jgi:DNA-binding ferritin-like protein (Dps family)
MKKNFTCGIFSIALLTCAYCQSAKTEKIMGKSVITKDAKPQTFKKIAPLTANALGARKNLDENGWLMIPPGSKSIEEVFESGRMSSKVAKAMIFTKMKKRSEDLPTNMTSTMKTINENAASLRGAGTQNSKDILGMTYKLAATEWEISKEVNGKAAKSFINGYVYLGERDAEDRKQLYGAWKDVNQTRSEFTGNLNDLFIDTIWKNQNKLTNVWRTSFNKSVKGFVDEYEESGNRDNALVAMWDIFQGYTVAVKEILVSPIYNTTTAVGETLVVNGVFVPVSHAATFSGQALITSGMVVYYPTKLGYRVISPTLEAGLLGTVGIATLSATAPTIVGGTGVSAFNQVTTMAAGYGGEAVAQTGGVAYESTAYATGLVYDFGAGTAESSLYALKSGIILSYTALTVIPAHLLLSVPDGTIFLAYDGPRVVIAVARGNYSGFDDLPTGTIINLEEAKKAGKVEILSTDRELVKKIIDAEIKEKEAEIIRKKTDVRK